jgi:hypothetical protein
MQMSIIVSVEMFLNLSLFSWRVCRANDPAWKRENATAFQPGQPELIRSSPSYEEFEGAF